MWSLYIHDGKVVTEAELTNPEVARNSLTNSPSLLKRGLVVVQMMQAAAEGMAEVCVLCALPGPPREKECGSDEGREWDLQHPPASSVSLLTQLFVFASAHLLMASNRAKQLAAGRGQVVAI